MLSRRVVAVVPAAGRATRLGPLPCSKEVLEVRGRPVLAHLVERARAGGADEVRVVTRPDKADVAELARSLGCVVVHGEPPDVVASLQLGLAGLSDDDVALVGFPDTLWEPVDGFARLLPLLDEGTDVVLGLFRTPDVRRSDHVVVGREGRVQRVEPKPQAPEDELVWGVAAARVRVLRALPPGGELGAGLDRLAASGRVAGEHLSDQWLDIGVPEALARAREL